MSKPSTGENTHELGTVGFSRMAASRSVYLGG